MDPRDEYPEAKDVRLLWHTSYFDVPLNGVCLYNEKKCFFRKITEDVYVVTSLSDRELQALEDDHELFCQHVGDHTDYVYVDGKSQRPGQVKPREQWMNYYEKGPPKLQIDGEILGWFTLE